MKTPHYSSAHQILRLGFKLWLDLALEGKACRGSSSLSYDIIHQSGWKCSRWWPPWPSQQHRAMTESLSIMQVPVCLSEVPQCSSSYWVAPAAVQKKILLFSVLSLEKKEFFLTSLSILRMDLMHWCLSFRESVPLRLPGRGRPPHERQQREIGGL